MSKTAAAGPPPALLAGGAALLFVAGIAVGRLTAPDVEPAPAAPRLAAPTPTASAGPRPLATPDVAGHDHDPDPAAPRPTPGGAPIDVDRTLAAARASRAAPDDDHVAEAALAAAGELEGTLSADPAALSRALEAFRGLRDAGDLEALASVLGRIKDPEVEAAALDIARRDASLERRRAALEVLDAHDAPAARALALEVLEREGDRELRRAALRALPEPIGARLDEAGPVVTTLARVLAQDPDVELRRRAAVTLGRWSRSEADLAPLLQALERDATPDVRAAAAMGLEVARRAGPEVLAALVRALGKPGEDPLVVDNAWHALGALAPLPADAHAAWAAHAARREVEGEGGGGAGAEHDHRH